MITSRQNSKIKRIKQLNSQGKFRKKEAAFVVEGIRLLEEAYQADQKPESVIYTPDLDQRGLALVQSYEEQNVPCDEVAPEVLKAVSDTTSPQGILAVFPLNPLPLPENVNLVLIADEIRDPGNLGALLRTSLAARVNSIYLSPGTVDPFSPKVLRSGMGAHFRLPIRSMSWEEIAHATEGLTTFLAEMTLGTSFWEADLTKPLGIIIGGEAHGPGKEARRLADQSIHIPMDSQSESLNVAAAGAILLFEIHRQRLK